MLLEVRSSCCVRYMKVKEMRGSSIKSYRRSGKYRRSVKYRRSGSRSISCSSRRRRSGSSNGSGSHSRSEGDSRSWSRSWSRSVGKSSRGAGEL